MKIHRLFQWCLIGICTALLCGCVTETTVDDEPQTYGSVSAPPTPHKSSIWNPFSWFNH